MGQRGGGFVGLCAMMVVLCGCPCGPQHVCECPGQPPQHSARGLRPWGLPAHGSPVFPVLAPNHCGPGLPKTKGHILAKTDVDFSGPLWTKGVHSSLHQQAGVSHLDNQSSGCVVG